MEKAGFIQEMIDDTLANDDLSDEADEEVNRVFDEITAELNLPSTAGTSAQAVGVSSSKQHAAQALNN